MLLVKTDSGTKSSSMLVNISFPHTTTRLLMFTKKLMPKLKTLLYGRSIKVLTRNGRLFISMIPTRSQLRD